MKKNIRNVQVLGIGVLTPALMGQPQAASARSIDPAEAIQIETGSAANSPLHEAAFAPSVWSIFDLSTVEKLKLGGSRIPALGHSAWKSVTGAGGLGVGALQHVVQLEGTVYTCRTCGVRGGARFKKPVKPSKPTSPKGHKR
jgi:hypothetical protein